MKLAEIENNKVHLCLSCSYDYPNCPIDMEIIFGDSIGKDNICCCNQYEPMWTKEMLATVQR